MKRKPIMYALALAGLASTAAFHPAAAWDRSSRSSSDGSGYSAPNRAASDDASTTRGSDRSGGMARDDSAKSGSTMSDAAITTRVKAALFAEPDLKSTDIKVETNNGVVQLSGFAASPADIDHAENVARNVKNVKDVKNEIRPKSESDQGSDQGMNRGASGGMNR